MKVEEYLQYDGVGLSELARSRQVSPRELLEVAIERIEAANPALNAVIDRWYERARAALTSGLPEGPLFAVPFLLKDTLEVAGTRLTYGSVAARHNLGRQTHELARRHEAAGLQLLGRTNMSEIGLLPTTEPALYGATVNPWNAQHSAGGSSGGAAAAVAAGMVPLAHADDGGGSIRIPASACGVFGFKPSRGRNPSDEREAPLGFIQTHCVSRTVRDSAELLDATHGSLPGDVYCAPAPPSSYRQACERQPARLRIAFTDHDFEGTRAHEDCCAAVRATAKLCSELGHEVEMAAPPIDGRAFNEAFLVIWGMCGGYFVRAVEQAIIERHVPKLLAPIAKPASAALLALSSVSLRRAPFERFTRRLAALDRQHHPADVWMASEVLNRSARQLATFFGKYDVLLTPVLAEPPWKLGTFRDEASDEEVKAQLLRYVGFTPLANASGTPSMSIPVHINGAGLPIGVQFMGAWADEHRLFSLAGQLEREVDWGRRWPPVVAKPAVGREDVSVSAADPSPT